MDDHADIDDPNDYPDPGTSSFIPYPALLQPAWGPYGKSPDVNCDASMDRDDSPTYPDLDESQTPNPYGASNEYTQLAEQFHMQYGSPRNRQNYHFPGAAIEYETDVDAEHD